MGTSASNGGPRGGNPLIPDWITTDDLPPQEQQPPENLPNDNGDPGEVDYDEGNDQENEAPQLPVPNSPGQAPVVPPKKPSRYKEPKTYFNRYIRSKGEDIDALRSALRSYSRRAAGGTTRMARRMAPATHRVARFASVLRDIRAAGKEAALARFELSEYNNRPVTDVLSAISEIIFANTGQAFEDTQDDSIVKQAYTETIVRITAQEDIDLDNLTNEQIEVMIAIFIEETIAQRVINDLGEKFTKSSPDIEDLIRMEEDIYQIISGMVRVNIMPEIIATQRGDMQLLNRNIENIYRTAFDAMAGEND
ncbi:Qat anti-phage system associated protein QatB [Longitalea luteola]|uniref:Qat anti-phage system associated protein QatB n=1 Tax=Longitalea luteola TaxID=2812563 RepID=UPI001A966609|nr:Qat anti-phage system associated protein QatB [Longitalea luteola]